MNLVNNFHTGTVRFSDINNVTSDTAQVISDNSTQVISDQSEVISDGFDNSTRKEVFIQLFIAKLLYNWSMPERQSVIHLLAVARYEFIFANRTKGCDIGLFITHVPKFYDNVLSYVSIKRGNFVYHHW